MFKSTVCVFIVFWLLVSCNGFSQIDYFNKLVLEKNKSFSDATRLTFRLKKLESSCDKPELEMFISCLEYHYLYKKEFQKELQDRKSLISELDMKIQSISNLNQLTRLLNIAKTYKDTQIIPSLASRISELDYMKNY